MSDFPKPELSPAPEAAPEVTESSTEVASETSTSWESGSETQTVAPFVESPDDIEWDDSLESAYEDAVAETAPMGLEGGTEDHGAIATDTSGGLTEQFNEASASPAEAGHVALNEAFNEAAAPPGEGSDHGGGAVGDFNEPSASPVEEAGQSELSEAFNQAAAPPFEGDQTPGETFEGTEPAAAEDLPELEAPAQNMVEGIKRGDGLSAAFNEVAQPEATDEVQDDGGEDEGGEEAEDPPSLDLTPPWKGPKGPSL